MISPDLKTPGRLWYLATVYSKHPMGIEAAFRMASAAAGALLRQGVAIYSPIAHTHPVAIWGELDPYDHDLWMPLDEHMMRAAYGLIVLTSEGWQQSKGIGLEMEHFRAEGKPTHLIAPGALWPPVPAPTLHDVLTGPFGRC